MEPGAVHAGEVAHRERSCVFIFFDKETLRLGSVCKA
jgi:hypothetical protein